MNVEANALLKDTKYFKLVSAISALKRPISLARVNGETQRVTELEKLKLSAENEIAAIFNSLGINERILKKIPDCPICKDIGAVNGEICECAYEQEEKIKEYNALIRLAARENGLITEKP